MDALSPEPAALAHQLHGKCGEGAASALAQLIHETHAGERQSGAAAPVFPHNPAMNERELAEAVRQACLQAALDAYEDAGISGLCAEGRWEAAIGAIQSVDLKQLAGQAPPNERTPG